MSGAITRTIELYIDHRTVVSRGEDIWRAYLDSQGPHDPPYGPRTFGVRLDPLAIDDLVLTATLDIQGFRLVFEDQLPSVLPVPRDIVRKVVITDLVPDDVRHFRECAGFQSPLADNDPPYRYAWRVTGRESHGRTLWEIVVTADDIGWAIRLFEEVRLGGHSARPWMMSPWQAIGL